MSKDTVKAFYGALKTDKSMAEELARKTSAEAVEVIIQFAAAKGYSFTAEDIQAVENEAAELSSTDLDTVNAAGCFIIGGGKELKGKAVRCKFIGIGFGS